MSNRIRLAALAAAALSAILVLASCSSNSTGSGDDDDQAPAVISDLSVLSFSDSSVTLTWTATGDDSATGTATLYELRYAPFYLYSANFDSATQVSGLPAPKPSGQTETFEVLGLETDSTYFFALKVYDEENNCWGVGNCASATCYNDFAVNIPDPALLAAIRVQIGKPTGTLMKSDVADMYDLMATDASITDLTGLEQCDHLHILNIPGNAVTDLSPLSSLTEFYQLHASQNQIADLTPLAGVTTLERLSLQENQVVQITALASLTNLTSLNLQYNQIADISSLSSLVQLESLQLTGNAIVDITPLVNNAGLGSGDNISLYPNPLNHQSIMEHVPALRARGATVQWPDNTQPPKTISDLTVDTVTESSVRLIWTAPGEDYTTGTAWQYELRYATNQSDLETWTGGETVDGMPDPDTAGTVQTVTVLGLTPDTTYYFAMRTQDNSENWSGTSNIASAKPFVDVVVTFADAALEAAIRGAISKPSGDIYKSELANLDTLVADDLGISDLSGLEHCLNLTALNLIDNAITDISALAELTYLRDLSLQNNTISDLSPLAGLENMTVLQLSNNPLTGLSALASMDQMWFLSLTFTGISDLSPLSSMSNLGYLFITGNDVTDLSGLSGCTSLEYLSADYNEIVGIGGLSGLLNLNVVSLRYNDIVDISPLVDNSGLGSDDQVALEDNPLSTESITVHIPALQSRGVTVTY